MVLPPRFIFAAASLSGACGEQTFQRFNSRFYRGFFALVRALMPGHRWQVDPAVKAIRSSVLVCNHVSYLDSILMISLFDRHTTIVKSRLFDIPVFGTMLRWSGYIPAASEGRFAGLMVDRVEAMRDFLAGGGNLIVFPRRARAVATGGSGAFNPGAFKIARHCRAPVGSSPSETPIGCSGADSFSFDTRGPNTIRVRAGRRVDPAAVASAPVSAGDGGRAVDARRRRPPGPETTPNRETPAGGETQP